MVFRLDLTLPLSDGGRARAERARAEASLARARSALSAEERALEEELDLARNRWERAAALERSARKQVVQADEEFRVTLLMYEEGYGSQLDVMEAQTEQQRARTEELEAVRGMCLALVDMRRAMGVYGVEEVFP
ncbi:TolC family protein [Aminithiophilus ramosus]|uniref:TolC family protein n=2 Tax=Synergistales TaxID=649776 RepID=A0A9Q7AFL2_9BACT|nr:TolC family protein [Aminithiophilus ramosus]QVL36953.1 TolC family protein [Synergistota bacterium]